MLLLLASNCPAVTGNVWRFTKILKWLWKSSGLRFMIFANLAKSRPSRPPSESDSKNIKMYIFIFLADKEQSNAYSKNRDYYQIHFIYWLVFREFIFFSSVILSSNLYIKLTNMLEFQSECSVKGWTWKNDVDSFQNNFISIFFCASIILSNCRPFASTFRL